MFSLTTLLTATLLLLLPSETHAATAGCTATSPLTAGTKTLTVNNKSRRYHLRLPNNYNNAVPHKLVFGLHWRDADFNAVDTGSAPYYGLRALDANNGSQTIFVAPDGLNKGWANNGGEDVSFIDAIVKQVTEGLCVDEKRVFSLGFSYGGAMSYSLACSRPNVFRAVAVLSGAQLSGCQGGSTPVVSLPSCARSGRGGGV